MVKNLPANAGDTGSIPGSGKSPGEGNGNPLQYSCLRNSMGRGDWWATIHGVMKELDKTQQLNNNNSQTFRSYWASLGLIFLIWKTGFKQETL